jgi:hypothetical protein
VRICVKSEKKSGLYEGPKHFQPTNKKALKMSSKPLRDVFEVSQSVAQWFVIEIVLNKTVQMQLELQNVIEIVFIVFYLPLRFAIINLHLPTNQLLKAKKKARINFELSI